MSSVTVVIPVYNDNLTPNEAISLKQGLKVLNKYKITFILPKRMKNGKFHYKYGKKYSFNFFNSENFKSLKTYNYMLLSSWFYKSFLEFDYILIYQLDAFVFKDDLNYWINRDFSYIGAPIFRNNKKLDDKIELLGIGNGGFSLRKVKDFLKVLNSNKRRRSFKKCLEDYKNMNLRFYWFFAINAYYKGLKFKNIKENKIINEDILFLEAGKRFSFFKIPEFKDAINFSFEMDPKKLYILNNENLPFGCHAWWKYDLQFYRPFFKELGIQVDKKTI